MFLYVRPDQGHDNAACEAETKPLIDLDDSHQADVTLLDAVGATNKPTDDVVAPTAAESDGSENVDTSDVKRDLHDYDDGKGSAVTSAAPGLEEAHEAMMLTNDEILLAYFKIQVYSIDVLSTRPSSRQYSHH